MIQARRWVVVALAVGAGVGCDRRDCPIVTIEDQPAIFNLSCGPTNVTDVALSGSCSTGDAGLPKNLFGRSMKSIAIASSNAGDCHVVLTFATGFVFSGDVTFVSHTDPPGSDCQSPPYTEPTQGTFVVNNPSDTCVDGGL